MSRLGGRARRDVPGIDAGARQRLTARFGGKVDAWFDELPGVLTGLAQRWQLEFGSAIPYGSMSAVFRCQMADGRRAVLKASPDRTRLASGSLRGRAPARDPARA
jgi:hypothetical protein